MACIGITRTAGFIHVRYPVGLSRAVMARTTPASGSSDMVSPRRRACVSPEQRNAPSDGLRRRFPGGAGFYQKVFG